MNREVKEIKVIPPINENYEGCHDCLFAYDAEEICIARRCVHAITTLKECYVKRGKQNEER